MASVNSQLRALREAAHPRVSLEKMAHELGFESRQAYHHYERENGYKGRHLPLPLARRIASVLSDHSINPDDVLALAGVEAGEVSVDGLTAGEARWVEIYRALTPRQKRSLVELAEDLIGRRPDEVLHAPRQSYRGAGD